MSSKTSTTATATATAAAAAMTRREAIEKVKREYEKTNGKPLLFTFTTSSGQTHPLPLRTVQTQAVSVNDKLFQQYLTGRWLKKGLSVEVEGVEDVVESKNAQSIKQRGKQSCAGLLEARLVAEDTAAAAKRVVTASKDAKEQRMLRERAGDSDSFEMGVPIPKPKRRTQHRPAKRVKRK